MHGDEVYFRDTAHGFLAWAVATLVTAVLIVGSVSSVVSGLIWMAIMMYQVQKNGLTSTNKTRLSCLSLFWH